MDKRFYSKTFLPDAEGALSHDTLCYSADGPDHWVTSTSGVESNTVVWGPESTGG